MRTISIRQPYAELIVQGIKDVENRSWATEHRGRLLIHASTAADRRAMERYGFDPSSLPRGAFVGVVDLADCTTERGSSWHVPGHHGWYLANPRRFSRPVPFTGNVGWLSVPSHRVRRALLGARRPDAASVLDLFSFGYWGWGGQIETLVRLVDAVEAARGFAPPIFVDVRLSRAVRAIGFRHDVLARLLGFERYRWFRTLGNLSIRTGENRVRIAAPDAAHQLLDLALDARRTRRRVVFFCACPVPRDCHRRTVGRLVLRAARSRGLLASVAEWPGTETPTVLAAEIRVEQSAYDATLRAPSWLRLPASMSLAEVGLLSYGAVARLRARGRTPALVVLGTTRPQGSRFAAQILYVGEESAEWNVTAAARVGRRERFTAGHAALA